MAIAYSTAYKANQLRTSLTGLASGGSFTAPAGVALYEPVAQMPVEAGTVFIQYFSVVIPVGYTTTDTVYLMDLQTAVPVAVPQTMGIRVARFVARASGDLGGSCTCNIGFATGGTNALATAAGLGSAFLQSANTIETTAANILAAPTLLVNDKLQLIIAANTTTTARTIDGFIQLYMTGP